MGKVNKSFCNIGGWWVFLVNKYMLKLRCKIHTKEFSCLYVTRLKTRDQCYELKSSGKNKQQTKWEKELLILTLKIIVVINLMIWGWKIYVMMNVMMKIYVNDIIQVELKSHFPDRYGTWYTWKLFRVILNPSLHKRHLLKLYCLNFIIERSG